jgi:DNA mismatch repair protein MutS2
LEDSRREVDELKSRLEQNEREARELTAKLESEGAKSKEKQEKALADARHRALSIVESVRHSADAILDELEEAKRSQGKADLKSLRSRMNASLNKLHDSANPVEREIGGGEQGIKLKDLKLYDTVKLADIDKSGTLIQMPDSSGNCVVQIGIVKTKTNVANLRRAKGEERVSLNGVKIERPARKSAFSSSSSGSGGSRGARANSMECDIRGMTADEGVTALQMFIDESIMNHIPSATIIHGKGTGVLRRAVHAELSRHRQVADYRLGKFGEGEDGVTIVAFRD